MDIQTSVTTKTTHTVTVTAPPGEPFTFDDTTGESLGVQEVTIDFYVDGKRLLTPVGARYSALGYAFRSDGTLGKSSRSIQGTNLRRLPMFVVLAAQEALRESVGLIEDPSGQLY